MTETTPATAIENESPTVLIVEDEKSLADLYETWLADSYTVKTAYDGSEALDKLDESVDVVLLDRRMPGLSGDDLLEYFRTEGLDVRVAIVSAVTPDFDVIGMGFDEYLTKPVDAEKLHEAVEKLLRRTEFDDRVRDLYQARAAQAALEAEKSDAELRSSNRYTALLERIAELQANVNTVTDAFTEEDFEAALRDLETEGSNNPPSTDESS